jgi:heme/copper-type cytochrome/quinol oxidase subunit 4
MEFFEWIVEAFVWCFQGEDKEWRIGRILFVITIMIAIVLVGCWLYR